jgi:hypothetical protein
MLHLRTPYLFLGFLHFFEENNLVQFFNSFPDCFIIIIQSTVNHCLRKLSREVGLGTQTSQTLALDRHLGAVASEGF